MKPFETPLPSFPTPAVRPLRTKDPTALIAALAALAPPFRPDVAAELIALGFAHADAGVRKKAMALVTKHVADAAKFKAAYRSLAGVAQHVVDERVAAFDHPYRTDISKALLFHNMVAATIAFERDAQVRGAILDAVVDKAKREAEPEVELGSVYWYWKNQSGWATNLDHRALPKTLFAELASRRKRHAFDGLSFHGGSLTDLPDELAAAKPWLKSLSLCYNPFAKLPDVVWELTNLEKLSLVGTALADIPADITRLTKLRVLELGDMKKLKEIPKSVCKLATVEELSIGGAVRKIPDAIGGMTSLRTFQFSSVPVSKLPACMMAMPKLKRVNARWTKLDDATVQALTKAGVKVEM